jgi:ubiquinone biosynthesis protein COQ4
MSPTDLLPVIPGLDSAAFLRVCEDPARTADQFNLVKALATSPRFAELYAPQAAIAASEPAFLALFEERYIPRFPSLDELGACAEGSLGRTLWQHLTANAIALDFAGLDTSHIYERALTSPFEYMKLRVIRCHDIFHALTGLGTSAHDEFALGAFQYAQFASPFHAVALASGLIHFTFYQPADAPALLETIAAWHAAGKRAALLPAVRWEELWSESITDLRARHRILAPGP